MGKGELAYILPWPSVVFSSVCDGWTFRFTKELSQRDSFIRKSARLIHGTKNSWLSQMGKGELAYILPWPSVVFSSVCDGWTFRFTKELSQRDSFIRKSARLIHGTKNSRLSQMRKRELAHILPWRREFTERKPLRYGIVMRTLCRSRCFPFFLSTLITSCL